MEAEHRLGRGSEGEGKMNAHNRVMFVDDEDGVRLSYDRYFSGHGFDVETAENGANAVTHLRSDPVDVVVADLKMPRKTASNGLCASPGVSCTTG